MRRADPPPSDQVRATLAEPRPNRRLRVRVVDDPLASRAHAAEGGPPKIAVVVNIAESPIEHMHASGVIGDAEAAVAAEFRRHWEAIEVGGARAIDYARPKVDGHGPGGGDVSDARVRAHRRLSEAARELGQIAYPIVVDVCGIGRSPKEVAAKWFGTPTRREERHISWLLREALGRLVPLWGYGTTERRRA